MSQIHEKVCKRCFTNYRPVTLLSIVSNVIGRRLYDHEKKFSLCFWNDVEVALDQKHASVYALYIDFLKAFNRVTRAELLIKVARFGEDECVLHTLSDYFFNLQQFFRCHVVSPDFFEVPIGVPQGSIFGVLLFYVFKSHLQTSLIFSTSYLYANDKKFFVVNKNGHEIQNKIGEFSTRIARNKKFIAAEKRCYNISAHKASIFPLITFALSTRHSCGEL